MRLVASVATALALLAACALPPPAADPEGKKKTSYNRRELEPPRPGVFTGRDGTWTIYRSDRPPPPAPDCESDQVCEPAPEEGRDAGEVDGKGEGE